MALIIFPLAIVYDIALGISSIIKTSQNPNVVAMATTGRDFEPT